MCALLCGNVKFILLWATVKQKYLKASDPATSYSHVQRSQKLFLNIGIYKVCHFFLLYHCKFTVLINYQEYILEKERVKLFLFENEIICTSECVCVCLVIQQCLILCDPMDCSLQGPLSLGVLQARILEWVAMPSSRGSSQLRDRTQVSCTYTGKRIFKKKLPEIIEFTRFLDRWSTYNGILYFYILETNS